MLAMRMADIATALHDNTEEADEVGILILKHVNSIPDDHRFWEIAAEGIDKVAGPVEDKVRLAIWKLMISSFALGFSTSQIESQMSGKAAD
jgi:hypothetical protein